MARKVPDNLTLLDVQRSGVTVVVSEDLSGLILQMSIGPRLLTMVLDEVSVKKLEARIRKFWRDRR